MGYRERIFERYASVFKAATTQASDAAMDRWAGSYAVYLAGWLPAAPDAAIADLASGPGWLLRFFGQRGYRNLSGVDVSPEQVALARKLAPQVEQGDLLDSLRARPGPDSRASKACCRSGVGVVSRSKAPELPPREVSR